MPEELGKIEKPAVEEFKRGRRLFFVPLIYGSKDSPKEYAEKVKKYWEQVEEQLSNLELKLGQVGRVFHELVPSTGKQGVKAVKDLNDGSYHIVKARVEKSAELEAAKTSSC